MNWYVGLPPRDPNAACVIIACRLNGCAEHPRCDDGEHTYEQHHSPEDHVGPEACRCPVYVEEEPAR